MDLPASVVNKRVTLLLSPLDATLTKKNRRGGGAMVLPGRTSIPVRCPDLSPLFATLRKTAGCVPNIPILEGVYSQRSNVHPSNLQTILSSHCSRTPLVPQLATTREFFTIRGTSPLPPVSNTTRADIGNCCTPLPVTDSDSIGVASRA